MNVRLNAPLLVMVGKDDIRSYSATRESFDGKNMKPEAIIAALVRSAEAVIKGRLSSGVADLSKWREVIQGSKTVTMQDSQYVREWKLGEKDHRIRNKKLPPLPPPRLVKYFPRKQSGKYGSLIPALLCNSLTQASEVFEQCGGSAHYCAHCGIAFIPKRTDQTCCTPKHAAIARVNRCVSKKRRRDAKRKRRK